jgi:hypothetical protein
MQAPVYADEIKIKDALQLYFVNYHFADGGYNDRYFKIKIGPLFIPVPNTTSRLKAVKFHDIHHVLTEYTAVWKGEIEIGAWEISSGCGNLLIAWLLNFGSFGVGMFLYPRSLFKAFMMGRNVKNNLYHNYVYSEALLNKTVGELRKELGIGLVKKNTFFDLSCFVGWVLLYLITATAFLSLFCMALAHY